MSQKINRNDPCPCGSGKKYKHCCLKKKKGTTSNESSHNAKRPFISRLTIARFAEDAREDPELMKKYSERSHELRPELDFEESLQRLWDRKKLRKMSTEEIINKLRSMSVEFDKTLFKEQTKNYISASRLANDCYSARDLSIEGPDVDFVWLAIIELWKRLSPEQINIEMIDDSMQDGYKLIGNGNCIEGVKEWVTAWDMIRAIVPPHIKSVWGADQFLPEPLTQSIHNWSQDFKIQLHNAGIYDESYFTKRIEYCREFRDIFPDTDELVLHSMYRAEAESYLELGDSEKAEKLFRELVEEFPDNIWGYVGWGDMYCFGTYSEKIPPDYGRAEEIYKMALDRCDTDIDVIYGRLEGLDETRTGTQ
jgi:tetratricopeptide (TPR) repeat protein